MIRKKITFYKITYLVPIVLLSNGYKINKMLYATENYEMNKKFNSCFVKYIVDDNTVRLGSIQNFLRVTNCKCGRHCHCENVYLTTIKRFMYRNPFPTNMENGTLNFIYECNADETEIEIIDLKYLKCVCYYIKFENYNIFYVIEPVYSLKSA